LSAGDETAARTNVSMTDNIAFVFLPDH
jgi:hypothetical protein